MKVNFNELIAELNSLGLTDYRIAKLVDTAQSNIHTLRTIPGREARYNLGARLVALRDEQRQKAAA